MFKLVAKISKFFATLLIMLKYSISDYFDSVTKLFSDLYLSKFLVTLAKLFFSMLEKMMRRKLSRLLLDS